MSAHRSSRLRIGLVLISAFLVFFFAWGCSALSGLLPSTVVDELEPGDPGPAGPQGEQGPPGVSPFLLNGTNAYYNAGHVGIGTNAPTSTLTVVGTMRVTDEAQFSTLRTTGLATLESLTIENDVAAAGALSVLGNTSLATLTTTGAAELHEASVAQNAAVGGELAVAGTTSLAALSTADLATLDALSVTKQAAVQGTLAVQGGTNLSSLSTSGTATLNALNVANSTGLSGSLSVAGGTNLSSLSTSGTAALNALNVANSAAVAGTLGVAGATSLSSLSTSGTAALNAADVIGNVTVGGTLAATGPSNFAGNATFFGPITGTTFGTDTDVDVALRVNGTNAFRLESNGAATPNLIGGFSGNFAGIGVLGGFIGGGGMLGASNRVGGDNAVVGGGLGNNAAGLASTIAGGQSNFAMGSTSTIAGGQGNSAEGPASTIAGGQNNSAVGSTSTIAGGQSNFVGSEASTIAGGQNNFADAQASTIAGGQFNFAGGLASTVAGGQNNEAFGEGATVPGGTGNSAGGINSLAAGSRARADHHGSFVWADNTVANFASTGVNQFLIRAGGNVGINAPDPELTLTVDGGIKIETSLTAAPNLLAFGTVGDFTTGAENTDVIGFYRFDPFVNESHLRLMIGDDPGVGTNDAFTIGTTTGPLVSDFLPLFEFSSDGEAYKPGGGSWASLSDVRLKQNVRPLTGTLDRVLRLQGYSFEYTPQAQEKRPTRPGTQIGLIAQEVIEVFPDWVNHDREGYMSVTERGATALLIEALRELRAEKDAALAAMQTKVDELTTQSSAAETRFANVQAERIELHARLKNLEQQLLSLTSVVDATLTTQCDFTSGD